jgi:predicted nucleic acid-binding protein
VSVVIADTGPLNYLQLIECVDVLHSLYGQVILPGAVLEELRSSDAPEKVRMWSHNLPSWVTIKSPLSLPPLDMDRGEAEAIAIAEEMRPSALLLIDDRDAREEAIARSLPLIGTVGVLESAAAHGLIDLPIALNKLVQTSHRHSPELIKGALERDRQRQRGGP